MAATVCASAQVKQYNRELTEFASMDVSNAFEVSVVKGDAYGVTLIVDEPYESYVTCNVSSSTLYIGLDEKKVPSEVKKLYKSKNVSPATFRAIVTLPATISTVTLHDKSVIFEAGKDVMSADAVVLNASDNASVKFLEAECRTVTVNIEKKAAVNLNVFCNKFLVKASGTSMLGVEQNTASSDVTVQGSATVNIKGQSESFSLAAKNTCKGTVEGNSGSAVFSISDSANINAAEFSCKKAEVSMKSICKLSLNATQSLALAMQGGATLVYSGDPAVEIDSIEKSSVTHAK